MTHNLQALIWNISSTENDILNPLYLLEKFKMLTFFNVASLFKILRTWKYNNIVPAYPSY